MTTPVPPAPSAGVRAIAAERSRQITEEGYAPEHDIGKAAQLFDAAARYADLAAQQVSVLSTAGALPPDLSTEVPVPFGWPWEAGYWKPSPLPIRNAEKSGALLAAALDALLAEQSSTITTQPEGTR